jgi:small-conductance mechanosensitive channel
MTKFLISLAIFLSLASSQVALSLEPAKIVADRETVVQTEPVRIDGTVLFPVRGIQSYPAEERARTIEKRIRDAAADTAVTMDTIVVVESDLSTDIIAGTRRIMSVVDADAQLEGIQRQFLTKIYLEKIRTAVANYRQDRSARRLLTAVLFAVLATGAIVLALVTLLRLFRRLHAVLERRYRARIEALHIQSLEIIHAQRIWTTIMGALKTVRNVLLLVLLYFYLNLLLRFFPWTRYLADNLLNYVLSPLTSMGRAFISFIPDLIVIVIVVVITRSALKLLHMVFTSIEQGTVTLSGFEPEWARPTYKIIRLLIIVFAAVVVYPYIPGSESAAFKGISLFLGIVFSLGSSSAISNVIAGYSLTYRRAFKVGDRVKIGDVLGTVTEMRMQVTHLHTIKNEEVTVPNSVILGAPVVNYSSLAKQSGLILHTSVTIGYDVPWRQVHAMLLLAAERTAGLLREPIPFVLQTALSDFYVGYELNAYTDRPQEMAKIYSDLHQNIQDAFNEFGVQIMSPHYEGDPKEVKIVPKEKWNQPPAKPDDQAGPR